MGREVPEVRGRVGLVADSSREDQECDVQPSQKLWMDGKYLRGDTMKREDLELLTGGKVDAPKATEPQGVPDWLSGVMAGDEALADAWQGLGKRTVSACDRVVISRLLSRSDDDILSALRWRPHRFWRPVEDATLCQEMAECRRMIRQERQKQDNAAACTRLVVHLTDPPEYTATIALVGKPPAQVKLTSAHLISAAAFRRRVLEACAVLVDVPTKRAEWDEIVRGWLASAEVIRVEGIGDEYACGEIEAIISNWPVMEQVEAHMSDLRRGVVVMDDDGARYVHMAPLRDALKLAHLDMSPDKVAYWLDILKWRPARKRLQGVQARVWVRV
jgi:hypothetical protein